MIRDTSSQDVVLSPNKVSKNRVLLTLSVVIIFLMLSISLKIFGDWSSFDQSVDRSRVRVAQVERGIFIQDVALQGNIIAANSPKLYSPADGNVNLLINPGSRIEQGDLIAQIDSPELTNRLQQEEFKLQSLKIELARKKIQSKQSQIKTRQQIQLEKVVLDAAERELRRAERSLEIQAISQIDYEKASDEHKSSQFKYNFALQQAELELENLSFEIQAAESELNQYLLLLENTKRLVNSLDMRAPVSGIIGAWAVEQRSAVVANQALITIVDLSAFQVEIEIPESVARRVKTGMSAFVNYGDQQYAATVASISPEVIQNIVKGRVAFAEEPPLGIKQNQGVSTRIILNQKDSVLYLPRGSFTQHHAGRQIFVVNNDLAVLQPITLGENSVDKIEVVDGLTEGQQVIISNTDFVQDSKKLILN